MRRTHIAAFLASTLIAVAGCQINPTSSRLTGSKFKPGHRRSVNRVLVKRSTQVRPAVPVSELLPSRADSTFAAPIDQLVTNGPADPIIVGPSSRTDSNLLITPEITNAGLTVGDSSATANGSANGLTVGASAGATNGSASGTGRAYTIRRGDTLWSISKSFYGKGSKWRVIFDANPTVNPKKLPIGQTITVP